MNPLQRLAAQQRASREAQATPPAPSVARMAPDILGQYQAAVDNHIAAMAPMADLAERQAYKKAVALPEILPFVDGYMGGGHRYPNSVAVQAMIWLFDVGEIESALSLALGLIVQGIQAMPKKFDRDMPTFVCDAVYDWANQRLKANEGAAPYLLQLIQAVEQGKWELHPAVLSKLYVMQAKHCERLQDYGPGADWCIKAQAANPDGHGTKTLYARLLAAAKLANQGAG